MRSPVVLSSLVSGLCGVFVGSVALAQTPPPPEAVPPPPEAVAPAPEPAPVVVTTPPPPPVKSGPPSFKLEVPSGALKVGFLMQPQFKMENTNPALDGYQMNLLVRRTRVLLGGSLFGGKFEYFFDTDFANIGVPSAPAMTATDQTTAPKNTPGMNIQDAFVTWKALGDMVKVDAGYMLPALAHNALQGATTLYGLDYFGSSFLHSGAGSFAAFGSAANPVGRDTGVQLRGLLVDGHLEYRVGLFQGRREAAGTDNIASNFFRVTGRLQFNLFDPETGFFYAGTYLGAKKVLSVGASYDFQDSYKYYAADLFADLPLGPGVVTGQANFAHWDGDDFIAFASRNAIMAEAGYTFSEFHVSPIGRFEKVWGDVPDAYSVGGGLAFWPYGHNVNLKVFYLRNKVTGTDGVNQVTLQWQLFFF
jgi:hypothetical protein